MASWKKIYKTEKMFREKILEVNYLSRENQRKTKRIILEEQRAGKGSKDQKMLLLCCLKIYLTFRVTARTQFCPHVRCMYKAYSDVAVFLSIRLANVVKKIGQCKSHTRED